MLVGLLLVASGCRRGSDDGTQAETESAGDEVCVGAGGPGVLGIDGGRFEVHLDDAAFGFSIRDCDGTVLGETRRDGPAAFEGLAIGIVEACDPGLFYDPKLRDGDGASLGVRWFRAAELRSGDVASGGAELVYATRSDDGEAGPDITVRVSTTTVSAVLDIEVPDDERIVFTALTMAADPDEGFHGLGQHFDRLDGRGLVREMQMQAESASESGTNEVHVPVPFVLSTRHWGLFVADRHPAAFDLARTREDGMRVAFFARGFRVHLLAHHDPLTMVEHYTELTAQPAHVPFWALGPVWWRNRNTHSDEVLSDARRARQLGFPGSLLWIDRP